MTWCNLLPPRAQALGFTPDLEDMPADDWKYADVEHVYPRTSTLVRAIIDATPLQGGFRNTLIDVKVQDLTPEICSCLPGWHLDGVPFSTDLHHLCVLNGPLTEFVAEPIQITNLNLLQSQVPQSVRVRSIEPEAITTFTSHDLHRGVHATEPTRRLLVRLTETNLIQPRNKPHKPAMGARQ